MVASNIKVYIRVRPSGRPSPAFQVPQEQDGSIIFELENNAQDWEVHNMKTTHRFRFDGILPMQTTQEDVFNVVAKPVIEDVISGVNGTIFAYGQTGSGKTFTITGGAERYADRGLIPRTISYMFEAFRKSEAKSQMYVSYLEIYNDAGYDLLRDDSATKLEDLPKVNLREDEDGNIHLRNLSVNLAGSEEDALNLLFMGDTNRVVAETPMNDASTRSHCLFIIWVDSTKPGSDIVRRSKLHLVDLAGSERVSKTGVGGNLLKEAKYINLSLHYLEQVIVALHERTKGARSHVPYRNSMMTSVLRDSLGGNCKTTMVGCVAVEHANVSEAISTCRFAQRVAQIQNHATVNEELDPNLLIARLKREVAELREEVRIAKSGEDGELTAEDVEKCRAMVLQYVSRHNDVSAPFVCASVDRLRVSFQILRDMCRGAPVAAGADAGAGERRVAGGVSSAQKAALEAKAHTLRLEIAQRDQEIGVLVQMLSKGRGAATSDGQSRPFIPANAGSLTSHANGASAAGQPPREPAAQAAVAQPAAEATRIPGSSPQLAASALSPAAQASAASSPVAVQQQLQGPTAAAAAGGSAAPPARAGIVESTAPRRGIPRGVLNRGQITLPPGIDAADLLLDPQRAFEVFRQLASGPDPFDDNKALLQQRIDTAKSLGKKANEVRSQISIVLARLEKLRTAKAMSAASDPDGLTELVDGPEELVEVREIERLKGIYREQTSELRGTKGDIERIQGMLEQTRKRRQREFEEWFASLRKQTSLQGMEEEKKRELYERVTAAASSTLPSSGRLPTGAPVAASVATRGASTGCPGSGNSPVAGTPTAAGAGVAAARAWRSLGGAASRSPSPRGPSSAPQMDTNTQRYIEAGSGTPRPASATAPEARTSQAYPHSQADAPALGVSTPTMTGDQQIDDEISAYFAALGELSKR